MEQPLAVPRLLCFSHLRWGFVWQRPQHLLTRFAADYVVTYVEEPEFVDDLTARLRVTRDGHIDIVTPMLPAASGLPGGFNDLTNAEIKHLLTQELAVQGAGGDVVWHYTPMSHGAAPDAFDDALVIFDAMDELANFRGAPAGLVEREAALLGQATLVFTGGPSLFQHRKHSHPSVHCFPSGVDAAHFRPDPARPAPPESAEWATPVLGFYGVLDERIDFDLIAALADLQPTWSIVLIGPLAKIAEADLPRRPNIFYPGKRDYRDLPAYLDQFDVAILPFALNDATTFISPTKTLEYLASGKPVVSTPIRDVIDLYGEGVEIAATAHAFEDAVNRLLIDEDAAERSRRADRLVAAHDWDRIAAAMGALMSARQKSRVQVDLAQAPIK